MALTTTATIATVAASLIRVAHRREKSRCPGAQQAPRQTLRVERLWNHDVGSRG